MVYDDVELGLLAEESSVNPFAPSIIQGSGVMPLDVISLTFITLPILAPNCVALESALALALANAASRA